MRSGLISSLATPWPDGASTAGLAAGVRLAGRGLREGFFADFVTAFFAGGFFAEIFFTMGFGAGRLAGFNGIGMIVPRWIRAAHKFELLSVFSASLRCRGYLV